MSPKLSCHFLSLAQDGSLEQDRHFEQQEQECHPERQYLILAPKNYFNQVPRRHRFKYFSDKEAAKRKYPGLKKVNNSILPKNQNTPSSKHDQDKSNNKETESEETKSETKTKAKHNRRKRKSQSRPPPKTPHIDRNADIHPHTWRVG